MKKFLKKTCLFSVPFIVLIFAVLYFYYIGYTVGEFKDLENTILEQRDTETSLLGLAYNEQNPYYKKLNANYYKADVIAVGTSRVMQFRKEYFSSSFYNCGGGANFNFDSYLNFIRNLEYKPRLIILGIDSWVFNDNWNDGLETFTQYKEIEKNNQEVLPMMKTMLSDWVHKKWTFSSLKQFPDNIGISGKVRGNGFRPDGSYCYGDNYRNPENQLDYQFKDTLNRIENGISRFEYGNEIDTESMEMLDELLLYCNDNDIQVIGFTAPLAPSIYDRMINTDNYSYLDKIAPACEDVFRQYGFAFCDFLDGGALSFGDDYYVDGFHGGDVVYAEIIKKLCTEDQTLNECVDKDVLKKILDKGADRISFDFENDI